MTITPKLNPENLGAVAIRAALDHMLGADLYHEDYDLPVPLDLVALWIDSTTKEI